MLLKFTKPDILNSELIDTISGQPKYTILTRASYILGKDKDIVAVASRRTSIINALGDVVADIEWTGREKKSGGLIRIMDHEPIKLAELFGGCETVNTGSGTLSIPTRSGHNWLATRHSLVVCNSDSEVVAKFHERCIQLGNNLSPSPIAKIGNNYLEFDSLSEQDVIELLVGFVFVNIMRRAQFNLPRYQFPLVDSCSSERQSIGNVLTHMKDSFIQRRSSFRRGTI